MPDWLSLLPIVGIALLFWLLLVRPAARRQKELARVQGSVKPGDEIVLASGLYGTVDSIDEEAGRIRIEVADGVVVTVARGAVVNVVNPEGNN